MDNKIIYSYQAVICKQTIDSKPTLLFSAPCSEITLWAGVPRKQGEKKEGDEVLESIGFQRNRNDPRLIDFTAFYSQGKNTVQNPILCAARYLKEAIFFEPLEEGSNLGTVHITSPDLTKVNIVGAIEGVKAYLEERAPHLKNKAASPGLVENFKEKIRLSAITGDASESDAEDSASTDETEAEVDQEVSEDIDSGGTEALFSDDHIEDFWDQLAARLEAINSKPGLPESLADAKTYLDVSCDELLGYLTPTILVDGQHRTTAAVMAFENDKNSEEATLFIEEQVQTGKSVKEINKLVVDRYARKLNVSLLLDDDPAEHVFQFVIVNQKASPISKVLLGTIVSTTLSESEINTIGERLEASNIPVTNARLITKLIKDPDSPFYNRVKRGLGTDDKTMLDWVVFSSLVEMFYSLNNGKLYHEKNDYAKAWRNTHLKDSTLLGTCATTEEAVEKWKDGVWETVFRIFWKAVKGKFASIDDSSSSAFWGSPATSNIFNKISLTILAASFFEYLVTRDASIDNLPDLEKLIQAWMSKVPENYFNREWKLNGLKKDATGIRRRWSKEWTEYRKIGGALPQSKVYGIPLAS